MKNSKPLVSIVTATYNMAHFIEHAILSIRDQTYKNIQHIIIDDGSTDGTKEVVAKYLDHPCVEYVYQENRGQTVAKNEGIKKAKGEFVCFLDADNLWTPEKLELQVKTFQEIDPKYKIIYTEQLYIDGDGKSLFTPEIPRYAGKIFPHLLFENFVTFNTVMVKKECFDVLGLMDETLKRSIDYELWLRFSTQFEFYYLPEVTTYYRLWEGQMSQNKEARYDVALQIMERYIKEYPQLLDEATIRKARSNAYIARGRYQASVGQFGRAYGYLRQAMGYGFFNLALWRVVAKVSLRKAKIL